MAQLAKNLPATQETQETGTLSSSQEDPLEEEMVTHSNILDWRIPWTEEPGRLQSIGSQRIGHNWSNLAHVKVKQKFCQKCQPWVLFLFETIF